MVDAEKKEVARNILRDDAYREGERKRTKGHALNMLKENMNISLITKITGLSEKAIKKISI